jgi:predicted permease
MTASNMPVDGQPRDPNANGPSIKIREVTSGYFETVRIPIVRGRAFEDADRDAVQPSVILSEAAARILFPGQDPIGHTIQTNSQWHTVTGVARDIQNTALKQEPMPEMYVLRDRLSSRETGLRAGSFAVRTSANPAAATAFLKQAVADSDPQLPVEIGTLDEDVARLTERPRFLAWLLGAFAGLAVLLAALGLYGVASYLVTQRRRDIGVRMALGAAPSDISRHVIGEAGRWIAAGGVAGCVLAWAAGRAIESQLYGVSRSDPWSWLAAVGVLAAALLAAVLRPASRASRVDPVTALRAE